MKKKVPALFMALALTFTACSPPATGSNDLTKDITPRQLELEYSENRADRMQDFAARLFVNSAKENENSLVSPTSLLYVLTMIANGADGRTLTQLEDALGADLSALNNTLRYEYLAAQSGEEVNMANAIWVRDGFKADKEFLQTNTDYFDSNIYTAPFDEGTVQDINSFVKKNTDGMIEKIIDKISPEMVICLVNALSFKDQWQTKYEKEDINDDIFTAADGTKQTVPFMFSNEGIFIEDENTTGFVKRYKGGDYSFVAMLPEEGVDINDYIASLTGEKLDGLLASRRHCDVKAYLPSFKAEFSRSMIEPMQKMGVTDLFDGRAADLSKMGESENNLYIGLLMQKTYISVDREGTKAGAVSIGAGYESAAPVEPEIKTVKLDRPFVYMIIANDTNLPLFIGSAMTV